MNSHGSLLQYRYPEDLIHWHKRFAYEDEKKALQIQYVAELFLICLEHYDKEKQEELEEYYYELTTHNNVRNELLKRLKSVYGD